MGVEKDPKHLYEHMKKEQCFYESWLWKEHNDFQYKCIVHIVNLQLKYFLKNEETNVLNRKKMNGLNDNAKV